MFEYARWSLADVFSAIEPFRDIEDLIPFHEIDRRQAGIHISQTSGSSEISLSDWYFITTLTLVSAILLRRGPVPNVRSKADSPPVGP